MSRDDLLLAPSTRLLHIGPFKTGTTAVQNAFHAGRAEVAAHGVHYAGEGTQPAYAALAVTGKKGRKGDRLPTDEDWQNLLIELREAGHQRVVISSEFFSSGCRSAAERVVAEIPGGPVHVVITLRSIAKIAPSQWQQYLQNGLRTPFTAWLEAILADPPDPAMTPTFWERHDHAELVRRWARAVGPENLTVVVVDETDKSMVLRTFESLTGLPHGLLQTPAGAANRSLTAQESEVLRLINQRFFDHDWSGAWDDKAYGCYVRDGAVQRMRTAHRPGPTEPCLTLPPWAMRRASEIGAGVVDALQSTGVRVVGDVTSLVPAPSSNGACSDAVDGVHCVPALTATNALLGAITGKRDARDGEKLAAALATAAAFPTIDPEDVATASVPSADVADAVVAAIEGNADRDELSGLPPISAEVAMYPAIAGARAAESGEGRCKPIDPLTAKEVARLLGVQPAASGKKGRGMAKRDAAPRVTIPLAVNADGSTPLRDKPVHDLTAMELVTVLARRGTRRLRKVLPLATPLTTVGGAARPVTSRADDLPRSASVIPVATRIRPPS